MEKSYRVDWSVVASEAAVAGIEQKEAVKLEKLEKLAGGGGPQNRILKIGVPPVGGFG